ncbi:MAG TPA: nitroreductase family protein [Bdellovibrionota bacterium]|nr:nitroreductase family protein [Bdellovibrionota bacterium]
MDFYQLIENHKSIRKYKSKPVSDATLKLVLQAAVRASSSGNMQCFSIIVTKNKTLKKKLYKLHFNQEMVLQAPIVMTFCSDFHRMRNWLKISKAPDNFDNFMSFMIGAIDATLASQNAALAAENEGLGICYMGTTLANCYKIAKLLKLPENVVPVVGFTLGYPDENPPQRDRLPLEGVVHYETYSKYSPDNITSIYKERETKGFARYLNHPELKKKILNSNIKNLAQIYTRLKYTKESHIKYSNTVLRCLSSQNFFNHQTVSKC